jgi:hypothetical protein
MKPHRWLSFSDTSRAMERGIKSKVIRLTQVADRRRAGRLREGWTLSCNLGRVRDLSTGGMRILTWRHLRGTIEIDLWDINRGVRVKADVVWSKRVAFNKREVGLAFRDLTPDIVRELTALAADNRAQLDAVIAA